MGDEKLYESVGIECGTVETPTGNQEVIGLLFPTGVSDTMGDPYEAMYLTLPAAKALLIDLKDAIQASMEHQGK